MSDIYQQSQSFEYPSHLNPSINLFKLFAFKPESIPDGEENAIWHRLQVWIPDTIIYNDTISLPPFWIYSSPDGYVYRNEDF